MITNYAVDSTQMSEWKSICKAYAKQVGAELLFVNETSFGIQMPDESFRHIYIDELEDILKEGK